MPQFDDYYYFDNQHRSGDSSDSGDVQWVFVHGYTCDHSDWQSQIDGLGHSARVVAVDLNGHGKSPQRAEASIVTMGSDVAALIHHLKLPRAVLVGHSMGCRVVLEAMANCRDRLAGMVLVDGSRAADSEASLQAVTDAVSAQSYEDSAMGLFRHMFSPKTPDSVSERVVTRCLAKDPEWFKALRISMAQWDARHLDPVSATIDRPIAIVQTTRMEPDGRRVLLQANEATAYTDYFSARFNDSRSRVAIIPDTNHFPQFEEPALLNAMLEDFGRALST